MEGLLKQKRENIWCNKNKVVSTIMLQLFSWIFVQWKLKNSNQTKDSPFWGSLNWLGLGHRPVNLTLSSSLSKNERSRFAAHEKHVKKCKNAKKCVWCSKLCNGCAKSLKLKFWQIERTHWASNFEISCCLILHMMEKKFYASKQLAE